MWSLSYCSISNDNLWYIKKVPKTKHPRPIRPGMDYFRGLLRGAHLLAHTWATSPQARGRLQMVSSLGIQKPPFLVMFSHYTMKGGKKSIEEQVFFRYG